MNNVRNILLGAVLTAGMVNSGVHAAAQDFDDNTMPEMILMEANPTRSTIVLERTFELKATPMNTNIDVKNATMLDYAKIFAALVFVGSPIQAMVPRFASFIIGSLTGTQAASFANIYLMALAYNLYQLKRGYDRACDGAAQDAQEMIQATQDMLDIINQAATQA